MFYVFELDRVPVLQPATVFIPVVYNIKGTPLCSDDVLSVVHMNVCHWGYEQMPFGDDVPQEIGNIPNWLKVISSGNRNQPVYRVTAWYFMKGKDLLVIVEKFEYPSIPMPSMSDDDGDIISDDDDNIDIAQWIADGNDITRVTRLFLLLSILS